MENLDENKLKEFIKDIITNELAEVGDDCDEDEIEEINTTDSVGGSYNSPFAFSGDKPRKNEKFKKVLKGKSLEGHKIVKEEIDQKDIAKLKMIIRDEVADILKTIWLKRATWRRN